MFVLLEFLIGTASNEVASVLGRLTQGYISMKLFCKRFTAADEKLDLTCEEDFMCPHYQATSYQMKKERSPLLPFLWPLIDSEVLDPNVDISVVGPGELRRIMIPAIVNIRNCGLVVDRFDEKNTFVFTDLLICDLDALALASYSPIVKETYMSQLEKKATRMQRKLSPTLVSKFLDDRGCYNINSMSFDEWKELCQIRSDGNADIKALLSNFAEVVTPPAKKLRRFGEYSMTKIIN